MAGLTTVTQTRLLELYFDGSEQAEKELLRRKRTVLSGLHTPKVAQAALQDYMLHLQDTRKAVTL